MPLFDERFHEYRDIVFTQDDEVTVSLEGRVKIRKTHLHSTQDYGNPRNSLIARSADRLYHGLIWIPGASIRDNNGGLLLMPIGTTLVPVKSVLNAGCKEEKCRSQIFTIAPAGKDNFLRLGFEAHDYLYQKNRMRSDEKHPVIVTITIKHSTTTNQSAGAQIEAARGLRPSDIFSRYADANGFLLSPHFVSSEPLRGTQQISISTQCDSFPYGDIFKATRVKSDCSQQTSFDFPPGLFNSCLLAPSFGRLHGHVNWAPATFIFSSPLPVAPAEPTS